MLESYINEKSSLLITLDVCTVDRFVRFNF